MSLLVAHAEGWLARVARAAAQWRGSVQDIVTVHHVGSSAVPGLPLKPVIDLVSVFASDGTEEAAQDAVEAIGYEGVGALGLGGRGYCRKIDADSGTRLVHA